ncbi:hypothetical protein ElyMa_000059900 [Elysia marginata]|uniref:Uncharacterized protein n=1 Tax=Elysia marginata TaxID=1093978 RepID=A0AAV4EGN0_9GAST|nr:hypothetical protein ElyMa_000059900 [Elysia marginata]
MAVLLPTGIINRKINATKVSKVLWGENASRFSRWTDQTPNRAKRLTLAGSKARNSHRPALSPVALFTTLKSQQDTSRYSRPRRLSVETFTYQQTRSALITLVRQGDPDWICMENRSSLQTN